METILSQYLPSKWTNSPQKDSFPRTKALLYEGNLAIRVVKVALLIFPLYAVIRDGIDLLLGHRHVAPVKSPINELKTSPKKIMLSALSALGMGAAIYFLANKGALVSAMPAITQSAASVSTSFLSPFIAAGLFTLFAGGVGVRHRINVNNAKGLPIELLDRLRQLSVRHHVPNLALVRQPQIRPFHRLQLQRRDPMASQFPRPNIGQLVSRNLSTSSSSSLVSFLKRQTSMLRPMRLDRATQLWHQHEIFSRTVSLEVNGSYVPLHEILKCAYLGDRQSRQLLMNRQKDLSIGFGDFLRQPNPSLTYRGSSFDPFQLAISSAPSSMSLVPRSPFLDFSVFEGRALEELPPELFELINSSEANPKYEGIKYEWEAKHRISLDHLRSKAQELGLNEKMKEVRAAITKFGNPDEIYQNNTNPNIFLQAYYCALKALFDENFSITSYEQASKYLMYLRYAFSCDPGKLNDYEQGCLADLRQLAYHRFAGYAMLDYLQHIVHDKMPDAFPADNEFTFENIAGLLQARNKEIKQKESEIPWLVWLKIQYQKLQGSGLGGFDPNSKENVPYLRSRFAIQSGDGGVRSVTHLRHGTPTMEPDMVTGFIRGGCKGHAEIIPEYAAFLTQIRDNGGRVGYFNHQKMDKRESHRVHAIQDLQKRFPDSFFFWSLPMDGAVFNCEDRYGEMSDDDYKDLIVKLFQEGTKFAIPESFKDDSDYRTRLRALLDEVHDLYFENQNLSNDPTHRRLMLLYFYAHLIDSMSAELVFNFIVTCCKDNKDRGGAMTAICEVLRMLKLGIHTDRDNLRNLFIHVLGVGVHTKLEDILEHRLEFLTDALEHLSSLGDDQIRRIQEHNRQAEVGQISGFEYVQDTNPFTLVTSRGAFDKLLQGILDRNDKTVFTKRHSAEDVFSDIIDAYRYRIVDEGRRKERTDEINVHELYDQARRDVEEGSTVVVNGDTCNSLSDLTSALNLPESADAVVLADQRQRKALEFMAFTTQTGGGLAGSWMHDMQRISERIPEIKLTQLPGGKELLVAQATFDSINDIYEVTYKTPYCFKDLIHNPLAERQVDRNSEILRAKIPFEAHYDLINNTVETKWWVENV